MPADVPGLARIAVNGRLLGFSVGLVVATALLFGAGLLVQSFTRLVNVDLGFAPRNAVAAGAVSAFPLGLADLTIGLAALGLAGVGIYGVIAVATGQRTREIGLRLAMGAQPRDMVRMVVGGAVGLAGAGVAAGLLATLVASRALVSLLFEISPTDLTTLGGVSFVLLLVAAAAACVPARRAARVDPLAALRMD